jgi:hypothetical protein
MIDILAIGYVTAGVLLGQLFDKVLHQGVPNFAKVQDLEYRLNSLEQKFISFRQSIYREDGHKNESGLIDSFIEKLIDTGLRAVINTVTKPKSKPKKGIEDGNLNNFLKND